MTARAYGSPFYSEPDHGAHDPNIENQVKANFWSTMSLIVTVCATAASKASVGFFILRLVMQRWHRIVILAALALFGIVCIGKCYNHPVH